MSTIDDTIQPPVSGQVLIRPFGRDGKTLADPFQIFENPIRAREVHLANTSPTEDYGYIALGNNLVVDSGRQVIANLLGGRDFPSNGWVVSKVSFGSFDEVPRATDVGLSPQPDAEVGIVGGENTIEISTGVTKKQLSSVDWPRPFIVRWEIVLDFDEAVGHLIRELGIWTANDTLFARKTVPGVRKTSDFGLSWIYRIRA